MPIRLFPFFTYKRMWFNASLGKFGAIALDHPNSRIVVEHGYSPDSLIPSSTACFNRASIHARLASSAGPANGRAGIET